MSGGYSFSKMGNSRLLSLSVNPVFGVPLSGKPLEFIQYILSDLRKGDLECAIETHSRLFSDRSV